MEQPISDFPFWPCLGIGWCVLFSAIFSGTETALTSLSDRMALQIIERGSRKTQVLKAWIDRKDFILSTLLVGNNLTNIAASVLSVRVAIWALSGFGDSGQAYADAAAVIGTTVILLIFAEVSPKTFAKHNVTRIVVPLMWFVRLMEYPLYPAAWLACKLGQFVVRVLGGYSREKEPTVTEEDIEYSIKLGAREGVFEQEERGDLLEAVLEFGDTIAKEVMIPRTEALALDSATSVKDALEKVIRRGHSRVPVFRGSIDKVDGILYTKDLLKAVACDGVSQRAIAPFARMPVFFVPETQKIADTLREMQRRRVHLGIVVDEFGGFSGIITIEDILEELVGEIRDEYDREEELVRQVDKDTFMADALVSIHDLGALLGVKFPDDGDYETLGGFVVATAGRVPEVGWAGEWDGLAIKVLSADDRHVERVQIIKLEVVQKPEASDSPSSEDSQ